MDPSYYERRIFALSAGGHMVHLGVGASSMVSPATPNPAWPVRPSVAQPALREEKVAPVVGAPVVGAPVVGAPVAGVEANPAEKREATTSIPEQQQNLTRSQATDVT